MKEKEGNIVFLTIKYYLKENRNMEKEMEKEKNIIIQVMLYLKENFLMGKNGMEKIMIIKIILFINWKMGMYM